MSGLFEDPTFWVAVGTTLFILLAIRMKVPSMVTKMLDDRAAGIKAELEEAKRLRTEAEVLLAEYRKKTANAALEAQAIIDNAKASAERMAAEAKVQLEQQIERRAKMAEDKIAAAERSAIAEVRAKAASAAAAAAGALIAQGHDAGADKALVDKVIGGLGTSRLN